MYCSFKFAMSICTDSFNYFIEQFYKRNKGSEKSLKRRQKAKKKC